MVKRRTAKSKGSAMEYDCQTSLEQVYDKVTRTSERGYQRQYDLHIEIICGFIAIECKRLKGISWNKLFKLYKKLKIKTPDAYRRYILFKSNFQPCLVFYYDDGYVIKPFENVFNVPFIKHKSTRAKK